jgi:hypothetical protein
MDFSELKCEACRAGAPTVTDKELATLMGEVPGWAPILVVSPSCYFNRMGQSYCHLVDSHYQWFTS